MRSPTTAEQDSHPGVRDLSVAALAGFSWGLGLARLIGEAAFCPPLFRSVWAVLGVAALCSAAAAAVRIADRRRRLPPTCVLPLFLPLLYVIGVAPGALAGQALAVGSIVLAILVAFSDRAGWLPPVVLVSLALAVYLNTLLPSLGQADTFEFQVIVPKLGVAHPTGYPLYVLVTKLFTLLPVGTVAWRVNLASAIYATLAVLVLYFILVRLTGRRLASFLGAATFSFSSVFWSQAVVAEVYSLQALIVAGILWFLLAGRRSAPGGSDAASRWLPLSLLLGLGLANHLTTILLLPAVVVVALWERPRMKLGQWALAGLLLLAGLSLYAFIPIRWPALNGGDTMTLAQFQVHVTGGQFRGAMQFGRWRDPGRWSIVGRLSGGALRIPALVVAGAGIADGVVRKRRALAATAAAFAAFFAYGLVYNVPDIAVFLIPAHLVLAIWFGLGVAALARHGNRIAGESAGAAVITAAALVPISLFWSHWGLVDQSSLPMAETRGRETLSRPLAPDSAVLADPVRFAPLYYVQQIEGVRPDIDIMVLGTEDHYRQELASRLDRGQVVYLGRFLPHLEEYRLRSVGPLVEVSRSPLSSVAPGDPRDIAFGPSIRLSGVDIGGVDADRAIVPVSLHWVADAPLEHDYLVKMRLVDGSGDPVWESEGTRPVAGMFPTRAWRPDETVLDYHEVSLPAHVGPGTYTLEVGLVPSYSASGSAADEAGSIWAAVARLPVPRMAHERPRLSLVQLLFATSPWLDGHDAPGQAVAGARIDLTLSWKAGAREAPQGVDAPVIAWRDSAGRVDAQRLRPVEGLVDDGSSTIMRHLLEVPAGPGEYVLQVGWLSQEGRFVPATCAWLARPAALCDLQRVAVIPRAEGVATFDDDILLLDAAAGANELSPGDTILVELEWRALREMAEDYTVFVQLVGPDGRLHGQVDSWPAQGTFPTSQWEPGEAVADVYEVRLDPDAPPGDYQILVGWYLLETMQRLHLVDESGRPAADSFIAAEFSVPRS